MTDVNSRDRSTARSSAPPGLELPLGPLPRRRGAAQRFVREPIFHIGLYYLALLTIAALLIQRFPIVRRALVTPTVPIADQATSLLTGGSAAGLQPSPTLMLGELERVVTTLLVVCGAIAVAVPVAWLYMVTKRLRFDAGLVRSIMILPIAVAGILLVVKNSLAIAFSLAGIVAAVRFRNTLKDPRDAVYIFLTIAIGIAAGVQALDVALVVSVVFNITVFILWRFQVGSLNSGRYGRTGILSIGESSFLAARSPADAEVIRRHVIPATENLHVDGILLVHTADPEVARHAVLEALRQHAEEWQALEPLSRGNGITTAEYLVELHKKSEPADLLGMLLDWPRHISAAEFVPFQARRRKRSAGEEDDDDDD
jgi:hypothetical protein